jgi:hypothetical protein
VNIEDAIEMRGQMEREIEHFVRAKIDEFQAATGLCVSDIELSKTQIRKLGDMRARTALLGLKLTVEV